MTQAYIGIGSNLGDRRGYIERAVRLLNKTDRVRIDKVSSLYETDPVGGPPQGKYLNGAIKIETDFSCRELLERLLEVEEILGRTRKEKNGPRTIDLDILMFGDMRIEEKDLVVPHPRMGEREFVKGPLKEIVDIA